MNKATRVSLPPSNLYTPASLVPSYRPRPALLVTLTTTRRSRHSDTVGSLGAAGNHSAAGCITPQQSWSLKIFDFSCVF
jgi:hypothetical protein